MTLDDLLWSIIGVGFLVSFAYIRSELREYRAGRVEESERMAQQQSLWPGASRQSSYR